MLEFSSLFSSQLIRLERRNHGCSLFLLFEGFDTFCENFDFLFRKDNYYL